MRQCVRDGGQVDFAAWQALGSDVSVRDFIDLERVSTFVAEMRWEQTDYYKQWLEAGQPSAAQIHAARTPVAVQQSGVGVSTPSAPPSVAGPDGTKIDLDALVRRAHLQAREAAREGAKLRTPEDQLAWLREKGYA